MLFVDARNKTRAKPHPSSSWRPGIADDDRIQRSKLSNAIIQDDCYYTLRYIGQNLHSTRFWEVSRYASKRGIEFWEAMSLWLMGAAGRTREWAGRLGVLLPTRLNEVFGEHPSVVHWILLVSSPGGSRTKRNRTHEHAGRFLRSQRLQIYEDGEQVYFKFIIRTKYLMKSISACRAETCSLLFAPMAARRKRTRTLPAANQHIYRDDRKLVRETMHRTMHDRPWGRLLSTRDGDLWSKPRRADSRSHVQRREFYMRKHNRCDRYWRVPRGE